MEETGHEIHEWQAWIRKTCKLLASSLSDKGVIIFYQTDRKHQGALIDKKSLISAEFHRLGYRTIMNKVILKQEPETINLFRPTFSTLFGFSKATNSGKATPDVIYSGDMVYKNAIGLNACKLSLEFIQKQVGKTLIVDPFCGQGSILKIANDMGLDALGVDIMQEQCDKAINLK